MTFETTVKLADAISGAHDRIDQARAAYDELESFADEEWGSVDAAPDRVYQRLQAYEQTKRNMEARINIVELHLEEWDGPTMDEATGVWTDDEFRLQMMSGVQTAQIEDRVGAAKSAMRQDVGVVPDDMTGERVTEILTESVVGEPDGIGPGEPPSLDEYPQPIMLWLFEKVQNFNAAGDPNFDPEGFGDATASDSIGSSSKTGAE